MKKLLAAISKNEIDMDCWIDYHNTLGFDILLYDDNEYKILHSKKKVKVIRNFDKKKYRTDKNTALANSLQTSFYKYAIDKYSNYDWIALLDCDEYLVYNQNYTLDEILNQYKEFAALCPNWIFFGNNGHEKIPKGRVFENFLFRQRDMSKFVKLIVQPKLVSDIVSPHYVYATKPSISANMDIMADPNLDNYMPNFCQTPTDNKIWINHYFCKSKEHWNYKRLRGYKWAESRREDEWDGHNFNEIFDDRCLQLYNKLRKNKLEIVTFIKNEEDLIYNFLYHHSRIVDKITIIDHNSTDNTLEIVNKFILFNKNLDIQLLNYKGDFDNKGNIVSFYIQNSKADIVIPLDADELIIYDDGRTISDNPKDINKYLSSIDIKSKLYKIRSVYNKLPKSKNAFCKQSDEIHQKLFVSQKYFLSTDCGYHSVKLTNNEIPDETHVSNISYIHLHYYSENIWLKNSKKKLLARLKEKYEDTEEIKKLADSMNKSHITAKEFLNYTNTGCWNNLKADTFFETPHLTFDTTTI